MNVFMSWSGSMSHRVAGVFHDWLPCVLQTVKPFMSSEDIAKGVRWSDALARELKATDFGIIFVTPFNLHASWLGFEAGALSKAIPSAQVMPLLFGVEAKELTGPLSQFQSTQYSKEEVFNLVSSLNGMLGDEARVEKGLLQRVFEKWWPDLQEAIEGIPRDQEGSTESGIEWLYRPGDLTRERSQRRSRRSGWSRPRPIKTCSVLASRT
jgi:hypothetical protein